MVFVSGCCHVEIGKVLCCFGESVYRAAVSMCYSSDCEVVCGENVVRKGRKCMLISAVGSSEMVVGGVVAGFSCLVSL